MHDFIALGVVPAVRTDLIALAVTLLGLGIWFVGPRAVLRQVARRAA